MKSIPKIIIALICIAGSMTSANAGFSTIIEVPPAVISDDASIIGPDTQINVREGGVVGEYVTVGRYGQTDHIEINVYGGFIGVGLNLRGDTTLNISGGYIDFALDAVDMSTVNMSGGELGSLAIAQSAKPFNISGGTVGSGFYASNGSLVNISGGVVNDIIALPDSTVRITGGEIRDQYDAQNGSQTFISGGSIGDHFRAQVDSLVSISGGLIGEAFRADAGSTIELYGTEFSLDGQSLSLPLRQAVEITERNQRLNGTLADGTAFEFDLNTQFSFNSDTFDQNATLKVTLVPEPSSAAALVSLGLWRMRRELHTDAQHLHAA